MPIRSTVNRMVGQVRNYAGIYMGNIRTIPGEHRRLTCQREAHCAEIGLAYSGKALLQGVGWWRT